nr:MAG TPA: hypothetical protein [Caudoviricetes sp.]
MHIHKLVAIRVFKSLLYQIASGNLNILDIFIQWHIRQFFRLCCVLASCNCEHCEEPKD